MYQLSPGNRVIWLDPAINQEVKATIARIYSKKAKITLPSFETITVCLDELSLEPLPGASRKSSFV